MPWDFSFCLSHALRILNWQENLPTDEIPPRWMWFFEDELEQWFDDVDRARKSKWNDDYDDREEPAQGYMYNELTERFKK